MKCYNILCQSHDEDNDCQSVIECITLKTCQQRKDFNRLNKELNQASTGFGYIWQISRWWRLFKKKTKETNHA